ncbi:MAG: putative lipid II flippase FtsW [Patescibacteria group bacterium]|nr:putative lipid II flippase FtsW [Patescibacteria group bacterium]
MFRRAKSKIPAFDKKLAGLTVALCVIGLVVISSASVVLSFQRYGRTGYYLERQIVFVIVGLLLMFVVSRIDYHWFRRYSRILYILSAVFLVAVLIPHIGFQVGNSRRWLNFGFSLIQPSEFAKLALILYLGAWFEMNRERLNNFFAGLLPPLLATGFLAGLIIFEPDFGSMSAVLLIALSVFYAGGARIAHLLYLLILGSGVGWLAVQAAPYRMQRILTFLNPSNDPLGAGYQINQAMLAIGTGGFWGLGLGQSRQKFNFLPEPIGDSVFAIMSEELGFWRVAILLLLFALFAIFGLAIARRAPDEFGRNVAVGITMWVVLQAAVNIGAMVGILPLTGITLPFISYGGSSMLAISIGVGIMLNISRQRV